MGCKECGKPKCNGECGCKSPKVLQINNPAEYITFHKVSIPAAMGDSATNPPKIGAYRNALVYYEADHTSWMYSTDGIPTKLTNGLTDYNEAVNLPQINGHTLIGNQSSSDLELQGELTAGANIQINGNVISATDTTYTAGNGIELDGTEIKAKIGDGLEFGDDGEINIADIEQYAHFFDTVADMKAATNLIDGSYARTLGYHSKNDGGGALYKIRNITNDDVVDEATIIEMNDSQNTLIAELVLDVEPNVNQFGAYGDGTHDDTTAIQKAFNCTKIKTLAFIGRCAYLISDEITLHNQIVLRCNGALIKANHADACIFISGNTNTLQHVYDFNFDGNFVANVGLKVSDCRSLHCIQPHIVNVVQKGIYVFRNATTGYGAIRLEGFHIENNAGTPEQQTAIADSIAIYLASTDSEILNGDIKDFKIGIKCSSSTVIYGVHHWNWINSLVEDSIMIDAYGGVRITNCYCDGIPIFVKQNVDTQYSNTEIVSAIYNYAISQNVKATPCPIYKGSHAHVNVVDSSFDASYTNPDTNTSNWAICNDFQNFFSTNVFCVKCYLENYYKGKLEDENIGTLYYERVNDVVYYNFFNSGTASSNATFADRLPMWAWPSKTIRTSLTSTNTSLNTMLSITSNGDVTNVTTSAYSYGNASYSARYALQSANV